MTREDYNYLVAQEHIVNGTIKVNYEGLRAVLPLAGFTDIDTPDKARKCFIEDLLEMLYYGGGSKLSPVLYQLTYPLNARGEWRKATVESKCVSIYGFLYVYDSVVTPPPGAKNDNYTANRYEDAEYGKAKRLNPYKKRSAKRIASLSAGSVTKYEEFITALSNQDPAALNIKGVLEKHGFSIGKTPLRNRTAAIAVLQKCYEKHGLKCLDTVFAVIREAYYGDRDALTHDFLNGLATYIGKYQHSPNFRQKRLVERLWMIYIEPKSFTQRFKRISVSENIPMVDASVRLLVNIYNGRRKKGLLEAPGIYKWKRPDMI